MTKLMCKSLLSIITLLITTLISNAQIKRDTALYPMLFRSDPPVVYGDGEWVYDTKKANGFRLIILPDTIDSRLFIVIDCFRDGVVRFKGKSSIKDIKLNLEGPAVEFYKNGVRKAVTNYHFGNLAGPATAYYPNGKLYFSGKYLEKGVFEMYESRDSTGRDLVSGGNGEFIAYDTTFTQVVSRGHYENALKEGEWKYYKNGTLYANPSFEKGVENWGTERDSKGNVIPKPEINAEFKGGIEAFYNYLGRNMRYPEEAQNKNIQGKVFITFVVEKNGDLSKVSVLRGIGGGCDEEAVRVVTLTSGKWKPAMQEGSPVKTQFTVPISFGF